MNEENLAKVNSIYSVVRFWESQCLLVSSTLKESLLSVLKDELLLLVLMSVCLEVVLIYLVMCSSVETLL